MIRIGIDTGGTFTDIVAVDGASGAVEVTKVASTPHNPAIGLARGVHAILSRVGGKPGNVAALAHGTTVATNALLQGDIKNSQAQLPGDARRRVARAAVPPHSLRAPRSLRRVVFESSAG